MQVAGLYRWQARSACLGKGPCSDRPGLLSVGCRYLRAGCDLDPSPLELLVLGQRHMLWLLRPILEPQPDGLLLDDGCVAGAHGVDDALVDGPQLHSVAFLSAWILVRRQQQCWQQVSEWGTGSAWN